MNKNEILKNCRNQIFDLANEFAMDGHGVVACELHEASNRITRALRMIEDGITKEDSDRQIAEWAAKSALPVTPETLHVLQQICSSND